MSSSSSSPLPPISSSPGEATPAVDAELDLIGEQCPFTFVRTKLALEALPIGGVLRIVIDHEPAIRTIPRSAAEWGQQILEVAPGGDRRWTIVLRRLVR